MTKLVGHFVVFVIRVPHVPDTLRLVCDGRGYADLVWKTLYGAPLAIDVYITYNCRGAPRDTHNL